MTPEPEKEWICRRCSHLKQRGIPLREVLGSWGIYTLFFANDPKRTSKRHPPSRPQVPADAGKAMAEQVNKSSGIAMTGYAPRATICGGIHN